MTQNQIAYWANVEKERTNRRNEEIASAAQSSKAALERAQESKAKRETEKLAHDVVQGYYKNTPGSDVVKLAAGTVIARNLGISDPATLAKEEVRATTKDVTDGAKSAARAVVAPVSERIKRIVRKSKK